MLILIGVYLMLIWKLEPISMPETTKSNIIKITNYLASNSQTDIDNLNFILKLIAS